MNDSQIDGDSQYEGNLELWEGRYLYGWIYSMAEPDRIVELDIEINGKRVETLVAGTYREDLFLAKKGSGEHSFKSSDLTEYLDDAGLNVIQIYVSGTDITIFAPILWRDGKEVRVKCFFPWTTLYVRTNGDVYPCICPQWIKDGEGVVGNQTDQPLDEIWNSQKMRQIREHFSRGIHEICKADVCPYLRGEYMAPLPSHTSVAALANPMMPLKSSVEELVHEVDEGCNLNCVMCRKKRVKVNKKRTVKAAEAIEGLVRKGDLKRLRVAPAGEALAHPGIVKLLKSKLLSDNGVHITIISNLSLMTPKLWKKIRHNDITIHGSIDSRTKEVYEKIRLGARWETVYNNLLFLAEAHKQGELRELILTSVVMGVNRRELKGMIELAAELGVELYFNKHEGDSYIEHNAFDCCKMDILDEIHDIMVDANAFDLPHVHLGSAGLLVGRQYRSFEYRMQCASMQLRRHDRLRRSLPIVQECLDDIKSGILEVDERSFEKWEGFINQVLARAEKEKLGTGA